MEKSPQFFLVKWAYSTYIITCTQSKLYINLELIIKYFLLVKNIEVYGIPMQVWDNEMHLLLFVVMTCSRLRQALFGDFFGYG